jgi:5'-nucleotidase
MSTETEGPVPTTKLVKRPEPIALFDLDGTLADFDGGIEEGMQALASPAELEAGPLIWFPREQATEPKHIKARRRLIKRQPGFWRELKQLPLGMALFQEALRLKFVIDILTKAPRKNAPAWTEKVEWCEKNLPMENEDHEIGINLVTNKGRFYGRMLTDDYPPYIVKWLEHRPRGTVIMPALPWNEGFSHPQVLRVTNTEADIAKAFNLMRLVRETCLP